MQNAEFCETNERCQIDGQNNIKKHNTLTEQSLHSCLGKVGFLLYTAPQFGQFLPFGICFPPIKKNEAWRHTSFFVVCYWLSAVLDIVFQEFMSAKPQQFDFEYDSI